MYLEYLADGAPECPLIRIIEPHSRGATALIQSVDRLISGQIDCFNIAQIDGTEVAAGLSVKCSRNTKSLGLRGLDGHFQWILTTDEWRNVAALIYPFMNDDLRNGYQWLWDNPDQPRILFTRNGQW
jgi:hypothetical protein